jgi:hypothetical protein
MLVLMWRGGFKPPSPVQLAMMQQKDVEEGEERKAEMEERGGGGLLYWRRESEGLKTGRVESSYPHHALGVLGGQS